MKDLRFSAGVLVIYLVVVLAVQRLCVAPIASAVTATVETHPMAVPPQQPLEPPVSPGRIRIERPGPGTPAQNNLYPFRDRVIVAVIREIEASQDPATLRRSEVQAKARSHASARKAEQQRLGSQEQRYNAQCMSAWHCVWTNALFKRQSIEKADRGFAAARYELSKSRATEALWKAASADAIRSNR